MILCTVNIKIHTNYLVQTREEKYQNNHKFNGAHRWNHATGSNSATKAHPSLVFSILASFHIILVAHIIGTLIDHETAALHSDGVTAAEVSVQVCAVIAALITTTLKMFVLVKNNLKNGAKFHISKNI